MGFRWWSSKRQKLCLFPEVTARSPQLTAHILIRGESVCTGEHGKKLGSVGGASQARKQTEFYQAFDWSRAKKHQRDTDRWEVEISLENTTSTLCHHRSTSCITSPQKSAGEGGRTPSTRDVPASISVTFISHTEAHRRRISTSSEAGDSKWKKKKTTHRKNKKHPTDREAPPGRSGLSGDQTAVLINKKLNCSKYIWEEGTGSKWE